MVPLSGNWRSSKTSRGSTVHQGSSAHSLINKGPGCGHSSLGFLEERGTLQVTHRTGRGVRITNPDFDLGWRESWGSPGLRSRATGSLHRARPPTEVPPMLGSVAKQKAEWTQGSHYPEHQLRELAGYANEPTPPSQSESREQGPESF